MRLSKVCTLAMLWCGSLAAHAMRFEESQTVDSAHVLIVRDCALFTTREPYSSFDKEHPCRNGAEHEGVTAERPGYPGDAAVLDYVLSLSEGRKDQYSLADAAKRGYGGDTLTAKTILSLARAPRSFVEVWLLSGGGDVDAGIEMARVFRAHGTHVRVPERFVCVSSCTLMFMGGVLRTIDMGAQFRVHSSSRFSSGISAQQSNDLLSKNADNALIKVAQQQQIEARYFAQRFVTLVENTLNLPRGTPLLPERDDQFCTWAGGRYMAEEKQCDTQDQPKLQTPLPYGEPGNPERAADVKRIRKEKAAALQDNLMRIERECMMLAIADLQATLTQRTSRAPFALDILRTMFNTSITDTTYMTQNELIEMGYVTREFHP